MTTCITTARECATTESAAERAERLRKQLRDNLQRRKQQTRARKSDAEPKE